VLRPKPENLLELSPATSLRLPVNRRHSTARCSNTSERARSPSSSASHARARLDATMERQSKSSAFREVTRSRGPRSSCSHDSQECRRETGSGTLAKRRIWRRCSVPSRGRRRLRCFASAKNAERPQPFGPPITSPGLLLRRREAILPRAMVLSAMAKFRGPLVAQTSIRRLAQPCGTGLTPEPKSPVNKAVWRSSSPSVAVPDSACHAGGRGFESRRSRLLARKVVQMRKRCCLPRRKRPPASSSSRPHPARESAHIAGRSR